MLVSWGERFAIGIPSIDDQHKELVRLFNELYDAVQIGNGHEKLKDTFDRLTQYTLDHFSYEERLLYENGYTHLEAHIREHSELTDRLSAIRDKYEAGTRMLSLETLPFLMNWLVKHIQCVDKSYAELLIERGVK